MNTLKRILIANNDEIASKSLAKFLDAHKPEGTALQIDFAASPDEAISKAKERDYNLVILDEFYDYIKNAGYSNFDVYALKGIKESKKKTPVVVYSSLSSFENKYRQAVKNAGADALVYISDDNPYKLTRLMNKFLAPKKKK